jgi:hypothetical protein
VLKLSTFGHVAKDNRINLRMGPGHDRITVMASAQSDDFRRVKPVDVYRVLLAEAMAARGRSCSSAHRGPVRGGACGHCGRPA